MLETSICVRYKFADGWHVFQSDEVTGLYVASRDAEKAFDDVGPSIELLLRLNKGIECKARAEQPFDEFVAALQSGEAANDSGHAISSKRFLLSEAVAA